MTDLKFSFEISRLYVMSFNAALVLEILKRYATQEVGRGFSVDICGKKIPMKSRMGRF